MMTPTVTPTIRKVYEKYRHLDICLSDEDIPPDTFQSQMLSELWAAVKTACEDATEPSPENA